MLQKSQNDRNYEIHFNNYSESQWPKFHKQMTQTRRLDIKLRSIYFLQENTLNYQRQILLIGKEWKMSSKASRTRTQATIPILLCDKMDLKSRLSRRGRKAFVPIKQTTQQEDIIILNMHTLNLNFIKQMALDEQT